MLLALMRGNKKMGKKKYYFRYLSVELLYNQFPFLEKKSEIVFRCLWYIIYNNTYTPLFYKN